MVRREDLLRLSHCSETASLVDLLNTERQILERVPSDPASVVTTALTFLQLFYELFAIGESRLLEPGAYAAIVARLEVLMCRFEFTQFRVCEIVLLYHYCINL